ncbi:MAG: sugar phosphate isomerase/epimerase family protein [Acholeplasmataceae bacterium]
MKPVITGFFDHDQGHSLETQIERTKKHRLAHLSLRLHEGEALSELTDERIKALAQSVRQSKLKGAIIDPLIPAYDLHDEENHAKALDQFERALRVAVYLKATHLYLKLPIVTDAVKEFELIKERLIPFIRLAQKNRRTVILEPYDNQRLSVYAYLIKKLKKNELTVLFDPVYVMMNKESETTTYRLLKSRIAAVRAIDADASGSPRLLGYGKTGIVTIFKKLLRDDYRGFLLVDHAFFDDVFVEETEKPSFFQRIFSRNKKRKEHAKSDLAYRLFPDQEDRDVTYDDVIENQIEVIKRVFR